MERLDRDRDNIRAQAVRAIAELQEEEARARESGDTEAADINRAQWQMLAHFEAQLAQLDGQKMVQQRLIKWRALVKAYRRTATPEEPRPSQIAVAHKMGWASEQPMRDYLRELGVKSWHDVHAIVAAAPDL